LEMRRANHFPTMKMSMAPIILSEYTETHDQTASTLIFITTPPLDIQGFHLCEKLFIQTKITKKMISQIQGIFLYEILLLQQD
jgi:hypothetical protein